MGKEPDQTPGSTAAPRWCLAASVAAAVLGLGLLAGQAYRLSATYDEVAYLEIGARWWRTGAQENITRMGSPLTFWKLQQAPTLWLVDRLGHPDWIDDPIAHQARLLPLLRIGGAWIWLVGLAVVALWARQLDGPRAMAMAAGFSPSAPTSWRMPRWRRWSCRSWPGRRRWASASGGSWPGATVGGSGARPLIGGLAFSCKFTTILFPPILALIWAADLGSAAIARDRPGRGVEDPRPGRAGDARVRAPDARREPGRDRLRHAPPEHPRRRAPDRRRPVPAGLEAWACRVIAGSYPQDWVGFATQAMHQRNGGPSYLLGERRLTGWRHYYPVALAVKVPLAAWFLIAPGRWLRRSGRGGGTGPGCSRP